MYCHQGTALLRLSEFTDVSLLEQARRSFDAGIPLVENNASESELLERMIEGRNLVDELLSADSSG